jgi:hypothetical protein
MAERKPCPADKQSFVRYLSAGKYQKFSRRERDRLSAKKMRLRLVLLSLILAGLAFYGGCQEIWHLPWPRA